ncbi:MAG: alpha/beta hydrolase family esterase [Acidimicrobiia bacterium]
MSILALLAFTVGSLLTLPDAFAPPGPGAPGSAGSSTELRPYDLQVPKSYDEAEPAPLVVLLHGYDSDGPAHKEYFKLAPVAEREGFLLASPNGTVDRMGNRFWNATNACCDFFGSGVDDVAYLDDVIEEITAGYNVDDDRVYLVGHSNGGFMSHRYACDRPGTVAAIVSLAGMQWDDPERCGPSEDVSVLQVHGNEDELARYEGGPSPGGPYPGAEETVGTWAEKNGCSGTLEPGGPNIDIDTDIPGPETTVARYGGCDDTTVELWTIEGGKHSPAFDQRWPDAFWAFMSANPKDG